MCGESLYGLPYRLLHAIDQTRGLAFVERIRCRIIVLGPGTLAEHDRNPARQPEQFALAPEIAASTAEESELALQALRDVHVAAIGPEWGIVAAAELVVQRDEIAHG